MSNIRRFWWVLATAVAVVVLSTLLAATAWAAASRQGDGPYSGAFSAMHSACTAGDVEGMREAMGALSDEEWNAMGQHMTDGHDGDTDGHMVGGSGMMGVGRGMMGGGSSPSMMGW